MNKKLLSLLVFAGLAPLLTSSLAAQGSSPHTAQYCSSAPNSTGLIGVTDMRGSFRISENDSWLFSYNCPPETWGVFIMGGTPSRLPYGDGFLCISPFDTPIYRLGQPGMSSPLGVSMRHLDFSAYPLPGMCWESSSPWYFQCYFRDNAAGGTGFNLSSGLAVRFLP